MAIPSTLIAAALLFGASIPSFAQSPAYLRLDQLGYEPGKVSRAYLVADGRDAGGRFSISNADGATVFTGAIGPSRGDWGPFTIYPLDFTVASAGRYTIVVTAAFAPPPAVITVGRPALLYTGAVANTLNFYQTQRDGPDFIANALRTQASHLNDAHATAYATPPVEHGMIAEPLTPTGTVRDASGGWWDAGDYLKFVETESYTVAMLLTGVRDFPSAMGGTAASDFTAETRFGLSWLLKMWDDRTGTLYYEVGIGIDFAHQPIVSDHDIWRLPQRDDHFGGDDANDFYIRHRPLFAAGPPGAPVSPNLAGRLAAAFALGYRQFRTTDPTFAGQCLRAAEDVFALADTHPGRLVTALPFGFYPEVEWRDDMEWGATELYLALAAPGNLPYGLPNSDPAAYLKQAAAWARAYIDGPNDAEDTLNLYDVSGLAHFELHRAIELAGRPQGLAVTQADLRNDLHKQLIGARMAAAQDPFGFGVSWATADTTSHGAGLAVMASEYAVLTGDAAWADQAKRWMGNIMGANIWGLSLIVGDGSDFPKCLQHQVANLQGSLAGGHPVLRGAAVEGPSAIADVAQGLLAGMRPCTPAGGDIYEQFTGRGARFEDSEQNYANTEPAIDLTASSPLMFAWRLAGAPKDLTPDDPPAGADRPH